MPLRERRTLERRYENENPRFRRLSFELRATIARICTKEADQERRFEGLRRAGRGRDITWDHEKSQRGRRESEGEIQNVLSESH